VNYDTGNKTSTKNSLSLTGDIIGIFIEMIFLKNPLRYLGIPGIVLMSLGIIFATVTITYFNETRIFPLGPSMISVGTLSVGTILLLASAILFSIGRILKRLDA